MKKQNPNDQNASWLQLAAGTGFALWACSDLWYIYQLYSNLGLPVDKDIFVIGDVHGDLEGLKENLMQAGLINASGDWIGKDRVFVQLGDIVDRGPKAKECWEYLRTLQKQAAAAGGKVVRLIGNHELMWLDGNFRYANQITDTPEIREKLRQMIAEDILLGPNNGGAQAAFAAADGKVAFLHAGLTKDLAQILKKEIAAEQGIPLDQVTNPSIIDRFNVLLQEKIASSRTYLGRFWSWVQGEPSNHPIFQVGANRGGNGVDGIFWADQSVVESQAFPSMIQVVGHNAPRGLLDGGVRIGPNHRVVFADAGLHRGNRCFVEITKGAIYSHCKGWFQWAKNKLPIA